MEFPVVRPGQRWRHYKGKEYVIVTAAVMENACVPVIVCQELSALGLVWVRPLDAKHGDNAWNMLVDGKPRFELVSGATDKETE